MVDAETLAKLKSLYRALIERPLNPDDPAYAELFIDGTLTEPNIVSVMASHIEFASAETAQLLGGQSGTGKTTLLRTLKHRLEQNRSYKVVICDMEGYLPMTDPVDVVDFLLVAAGALSEALAVPELLGRDPARASYWSRFARWVKNTDIDEAPLDIGGLTAGSNVARTFKTDLSFRERIREQTKARVNGFHDDVHAFMKECLFALRKRYGEDTQLVVIFDGIEHIRGLTSNADAVAESIERLFWGHAEALRIPLVHVIFTVPLWLHLHYPRQFYTYRQVPCVKVRNHPSQTGLPGEPNLAGIEALRRLVQKRGDDGWLDWVLGSPEAFDELALVSGGHLRDLLFLLRILLIDAHDVGVPVPEHRRRRAIEELRASYDQGLSNDDAAWLQCVEKNSTIDSDVPVRRIGAFLLFYRNRDGRGWYGIRPVIRDEVLRRTRARDDDAEISAKIEVVPAVRVAALELEQIRCFEHAVLDFEHEGGIADWLLLLGDNALGKSTLLRAIALGLCAESEAAALLEATPGPLLRNGQTEGRITLTLADADGNRYWSITQITKDAHGEPEKLRRVRWDLSANQVFVCAYGPNRTRTADLSHSGFSRHDAVRSLFDDETSLQNPELVLRRQDEPSRQRIQRKLLEILMLDPEHASVQYSSTHGLQIHGPWTSGGSMLAELGILSDGYRSTTQWIIDLIGWLVYAGRFGRNEDISGIVLVDELEQHLHPHWQRYIIGMLHTQFPRLQFIASTHAPLLALGLADQERGLLVQLTKDREQQIQAKIVDARDFAGLRADQILTAHRGFALPTTRSPGSVDNIARFDELLSKQRSDAEERELAELRAHLEATSVLGETPYERRVEAAVREALAKPATEPPGPRDEVQEHELRRQLAELFGRETST